MSNDDDEEEPEELLRITVMVESHGDCLYAYESENGYFLGQGFTFDELEDKVRSRIPDFYNESVTVQLMTVDKELLSKFS